MTASAASKGKTGAGPGGAAGAAGAGTDIRLSCRGVTVRFGGLVAVNEVDVAVPQGQIVGLVGPNGAGKSTLFGVLSGLLRPTKGSVLLDGDDVTGSRPQLRAERGLARTFQHPEIFAGLTVREHLVLAYRARHMKRRIWSDLFTMGSLHPASAGEQETVDGLLELVGLSAAGGPVRGRAAAGHGTARRAGPGARGGPDRPAAGRTLLGARFRRDRAVRAGAEAGLPRARHVHPARRARRRARDAPVHHDLRARFRRPDRERFAGRGPGRPRGARCLSRRGDR